MSSTFPVLYSFRRCPYAIRARLAILYSGADVELREILFKDKPESMLCASPKGTVPVLILNNGQVIDESCDVMRWALDKNDPQHWFHGQSEAMQKQMESLIEINDQQFKPILDKYKYAVRHPEQTQDFYRQQGAAFLQTLELSLSHHAYLLGDNMTLADVAIFPFIRQFAWVDKEWFDQTHYKYVQNWLLQFLQSELFSRVMKKHSPWKLGDTQIIL